MSRSGRRKEAGLGFDSVYSHSTHRHHHLGRYELDRRHPHSHCSSATSFVRLFTASFAKTDCS